MKNGAAERMRRLHGKGGWSIEVRGAEALAPGVYWAIHRYDPPRRWLELVKQRPTSPDGRAATTAIDEVRLPDGQLGCAFGVVVKTEHGNFRRATDEQRRSVGDLLPVGGVRLELVSNLRREKKSR